MPRPLHTGRTYVDTDYLHELVTRIRTKAQEAGEGELADTYRDGLYAAADMVEELIDDVAEEEKAA